MAWRINSLLREAIQLHSTNDLESEDFMDLLLVEKNIKLMKEDQLLNECEQKVIDLLAQSYSLNQIAVECNFNATFVYTYIKRVTDKIAEYVGEEFTDIGFMKELTEKYNLNSEEIARGVKYINGGFKSNVVRGKQN